MYSLPKKFVIDIISKLVEIDTVKDMIEVMSIFRYEKIYLTSDCSLNTECKLFLQFFINIVSVKIQKNICKIPLFDTIKIFQIAKIDVI